MLKLKGLVFFQSPGSNTVLCSSFYPEGTHLCHKIDTHDPSSLCTATAGLSLLSRDVRGLKAQVPPAVSYLLPRNGEHFMSTNFMKHSLFFTSC
jgi:hypothetical protein